MNVSCPQCKTVFRVDPHKVAPGGTRARCSICGGVFEVNADGQRPPPTRPDRDGLEDEIGSVPATGVAPGPPGAAGEPAGLGEPPVVPAPPETRAPETPTHPEPRMPEAAARQDLHAGLTAERQDAVEAPAAEEAPPQPAAPEAPKRTPFGPADPEARSRRLARALISDMVAYHPERQDLGLQENRLKELFREDIKKAWREYVDQVGLETAKNKPYFREALNEILARGREVF